MPKAHFKSSLWVMQRNDVDRLLAFCSFSAHTLQCSPKSLACIPASISESVLVCCMFVCFKLLYFIIVCNFL